MAGIFKRKPSKAGGEDAEPSDADGGMARLRAELNEERERRIALEAEMALPGNRIGRHLLSRSVNGDGIAAIGTDGRIAWCNTAMVELGAFGSADEAVGQTPADAWGEPDPEGKDGARPSRGEFVLFRADGETREVSVRTVFLKDDEGELWISSYRDISEQKQAERRLRETNHQFEQLARNMSEVLWISSDDQTGWSFVSDAFERIWGRPPAELKGGFGLFTVHPDDRPDFLLAFRDVMASGEKEMIYRIIRPDGEIRWVRTRAFPIRDENGIALRIGGTSEDITARREAEEAVRNAERQKEQFYRFLVHDLNKPIAAIVGFSTNLKGRADLPDSARPFAERINNASVRLRGIVSQALENQRIQRGEVKVSFGRVDLWRQIGEIASYIEERDLTREILIGGRPLGAPGEFPVIEIESDAVCLGRVLQNLVDNALKYGRSRMELDAALDGDTVRIEIWNDGPPIPAELHEQIFSEFYRARGQKEPGTGIGLASVRKLVSMINGRVGVSIPERGGTMFFVELPAGPVSARSGSGEGA